jgi:hypothetical protein
MEIMVGACCLSLSFVYSELLASLAIVASLV